MIEEETQMRIGENDAGADYGAGICRLIRWLRGLMGMRLIMGR